MALPFYMPTFDGYFKYPTPPVNYMHQGGYNQPSYETPYAHNNNQGTYYGQQHYPGYQPNVLQPSQAYGMAAAPYSDTSNMSYPNIAYPPLAPPAAKPQAVFQGTEPQVSFTSQLRSAAEHAAKSEARLNPSPTYGQVQGSEAYPSGSQANPASASAGNYTYRHDQTYGTTSIAGSSSQATSSHATEYLTQHQLQSKPVIVPDVLIAPPQTRSSHISPSPGIFDVTSVANVPQPQFVPSPLSQIQMRTGSGFELALAADPSLGQRALMGDIYRPGAGEATIANIKDIMENLKPSSSRAQKYGAHHFREPVKPPVKVQTSQKRKAEDMIPEKSDSSASKKHTECSHKRKAEEMIPVKRDNTVPQKQTDPEVQPYVNNACPCIEVKKRKIFGNSGSLDNPKLPRQDWYPKPASAQLDQLFLGPNKTCVPSHVYASIPWEESLEDSTKILMEYIFDEKTLATHHIHVEPRLDPAKVEDIAGLVADKCFVSEKLVRSYMVTICSDKAKETQQSS